MSGFRLNTRKIPYLMLHMSLLSLQPPLALHRVKYSAIHAYIHEHMSDKKNINNIRPVLVDDANILYRTQWKKFPNYGSCCNKSEAANIKYVIFVQEINHAYINKYRYFQIDMDEHVVKYTHRLIDIYMQVQMQYHERKYAYVCM